jgi:hypothetical protein
MGPLVHLQVGAFIANARDYSLRERRLVMLSALAQDFDGIFIYPPELWHRMHHTFSNNIFWSLMIGILFALYNRGRRIEMFIVCTGAAFLQSLLDLITNDPSWPHMYLWPVSKFDFSLGNFIEWEHLSTLLTIGIQWPLMAAVFAGTVFLYIKNKRTFLELISVNLDVFITNFLKNGFLGKERCSVCGQRAFYSDKETNEALCPEHAHIEKNLTVTKVNDEHVNGEKADD